MEHSLYKSKSQYVIPIVDESVGSAYSTTVIVPVKKTINSKFLPYNPGLNEGFVSKGNQYLSSPVSLHSELYTGVYDPDNPASYQVLNFENYIKQTRLEVIKLIHSSLQNLKCSLMQINTTDVLLNTVCKQNKIGLQGLQFPSSMLACKNNQLTSGLDFNTWDIGDLFKITPTLIFKP